MLWGGAAVKAFQESQQKWKQPMAVEMSLTVPGFAPWRGDMSPFSDEQRLQPTHGGKGMCVGGQQWVAQMLWRTHTQGRVYNSYNTPLATLPNITFVDCFLGALVAAGFPPQMADFVWPPAHEPARDARVKFWMDKANAFGHNTESSTNWLHIGVGNGDEAVFFVGFADGDDTTAEYCGLYAASNAWVTLPAASWSNTTVVAYVTTSVPNQTARFTFGGPGDTAARFFAASNATLRMGGGFWMLSNENVRQEVTAPDGAVTTSMVFSAARTGSQNVTSPALRVGSTIAYTKVPGGNT